VFILTGGDREQMEQLFYEVHEAGTAESPHAQESHITIWVCRRPRRPIADVWMDYKSFV
jgi:hypothetical protein